MILLRKELTELGLSGRTPAIRLVFGLLFTAAFFVWVSPSLSWGAPANAIGSGRTIFYSFYSLLTIAVYLVTPVAVISAFHDDTGRGEIDLLRLTTLGPGTIVLQKLLGRLVHVSTCVAVSFPIFALAYSYGGVADRDLVHGFVALVATLFLVGSLSLYAAMRSRTLGASLAIAAGQLALMHVAVLVFSPSWVSHGFAPMTAFLVDSGAQGLGGLWMIGAAGWTAFLTVTYLRRAKERLTDFGRPAGPARLPRFDARRLSRARGLPVDHPVHWRATATPWFRAKPGAPGPHMVVAVTVMFAFLSPFRVLAFVMWAACAAAVAVSVARAIAQERRDGTLAVLLATPLTARAIATQKLGCGLRLLPVLTVAWGGCLLLNGLPGLDSGRWPLSLGPGVVLLVVGLVLTLLGAAFLGALVGLRVRHAAQAAVVAVSAVLIWFWVPMIGARAVGEIAWLSPVGSIIAFDAMVMGGIDTIGKSMGPLLGLAAMTAGFGSGVSALARRWLMRDV